MHDEKTFVFIHGVGGPARRETWLTPLNRGLAELKYSQLDEQTDRIYAPAYLDALYAGDDGPAQADTWHTPEERVYADASAAYRLRIFRSRTIVARWQQESPGPHFGHVPVTPLHDVVAERFFDVVRLYKNARNRNAAHRALLQNQKMPTTGSAVVVAHSFGSVVIADILKKLPRGLIVKLLITIGSPLALDSMGSSSKDLTRMFPCDRVYGWVNIFDRGDICTSGRGISARFGHALDAPIHIDGAHALEGYMSHPMVADLVGHTLFGERSKHIVPDVPVRRLHPDWHHLLLNFAFTAQLSAQCEPKQWKLKKQLETARAVLARRVVDDVERRRLDAGSAGSEFDDSPIGSGRSPNEEDLLRRAADLVRNTWTDDELVPLGISLAMSPPLPPFDIEIKEQARYGALAAVFNRVRRGYGDLDDRKFADRVREAVHESEKALSAFPLGQVLLFGGLALLVLTGVELTRSCGRFPTWERGIHDAEESPAVST